MSVSEPPVQPIPAYAATRPATGPLTDAVRALLLTLAAFAVGQAIHIRDGEYDGVAIRWIAVAMAGTLGALLLPQLPAEKRLRWLRHAALASLASAIGFCLYQLMYSPISGWNYWSDDLIHTDERTVLIFKAGLTFAIAGTVALLAYRWRWWAIVLAVAATFLAFAVSPTPIATLSGLSLPLGMYAAATVALAIVLSRGRFWGVPLAIILGSHAMLGGWMVHACPSPKIDVFVFQQVGAHALQNGDNPYAVTYPDIYAGTRQAEDRDVYGKGLSQDGKLAFGFPYPPLSLLLSTAGYLIGGDHRYAQAAAMTLSGLLLALSRPGRWAALATLLLLFTPRAFFILGRAWTEPLVVCLLALTIFTAYRFPRLLPIALGLFLASKQYLVFAVPLAWLLVPDWRDWRSALKLIGGALLVTAAVSLPLALWDFKSFWHSTITVQQVSPFREDALSWLVWYFQKTGVKPDAWVAFAIAGPMLVLALALCPRTPGGFALGLAAVYLPFIAFNKQAFANYYLFVIGALVCAMATLHPTEPVDEPTPPNAKPHEGGSPRRHAAQPLPGESPSLST